MAEAEQMETTSIAFLAQVAHGMVCCPWVEMQLLWLYNFEEKESVSYRFAHIPCGHGCSLILGFPAAQRFSLETRYLRNICGWDILNGLPKISQGSS